MSIKRRYVEVDLNGERKLLRFDFNSVVELEEYFDKGIGAIFRQENVGFRTIRAFYWIGLKWNDRMLTLEKVGELLSEEIANGQTIESLMTPLLSGLQVAGIIPKKKEELQEGEYEDIEGNDSKN